MIKVEKEENVCNKIKSTPLRWMGWFFLVDAAEQCTHCFSRRIIIFIFICLVALWMQTLLDMIKLIFLFRFRMCTRSVCTHNLFTDDPIPNASIFMSLHQRIYVKSIKYRKWLRNSWTWGNKLIELILQN